MSWGKSRFIAYVEDYDFIREVGDMGTTVVAYDAHESREMKAFGGLIEKSGWIPVAVNMDSRAVFFAPVEQVNQE